jgi:serine/threonine-protein kinase
VSAEEPTYQDEQLAWLAAWHEGLAAGEEGALPGAAVPPELRARLEADMALVRRLEQHWPRPGAATPGTRRTNAPAGERAEPSAGGSALPERIGRYQVLDTIAQGGMGAVLRARDLILGRDLAIKLLLDRHQGQPDLLARFLEEAQIAGQLEHPGIVPVHELGESGGRPYFTMKLVQGQTLAALLAARRTPADDLPRFLHVFEQVCQAVAYAHSQGVIHRDLKPLNIMVGAFGEVQVMDWGLAKVLAEDRRERQRPETTAGGVQTVRSGQPQTRSLAGMVVGTPAYMAPEQARGEIDLLDERCDVFGLGAILCEILTGQPPHGGDSREEVLRRVREGNLGDALARLDACGADLPLLLLARRCLAAEPAERPRDAGAVAAEVTAYQASVQERLRQAELARAQAQARAAQERKARLLMAFLALAVVVAGLLGGIGWRWRERQRLLDENRRAETEMVVQAALEEVARLRTEGKWSEARTALGRARDRLGVDAPDGLKDRVRQAEANLTMVETLERLAMEVNTRFNENDSHALDRAYAKAFREYGLPVLELDRQEAKDRITASGIPQQIAAGLNHWLLEKPKEDTAGRKKLTALLTLSPGAPRAAWPEQLNQASARKDHRALERLAGDAWILSQPPTTVWIVAQTLANGGAKHAGVALLKNAQQRHPGHHLLNHELGVQLSKDNPAEAVGFLRVALAARPQSAAVSVNLGYTLFNLRRYAEAETEFHRAIALAPGDATAHFNLGNALTLQNRLVEGEAAYRRAIAIESDYPRAHSLLGWNLLQQGQFGKAEVAYRQAVAREKKSGVSDSSTLAVCLAKQGKASEAEAALREAAARAGTSAPAHTLLGRDLSRMDRLPQAEAVLRKAIALRNDHPDAHFHLGNVLAKQGRTVEAEAALRHAIALNRQRPEFHHDLGANLLQQGRFPEAEAACRQALGLRPEYPRALNTLALTFIRRGMFAEAAVPLRRALALPPGYNPAHLHVNLGHVLKRQGKLAEALSCLRRGVELADPKGPDRRRYQGQVAACERLIELDRKLDPILRGQTRPASAGETISFASLCLLKGLYATSVRFYRDGFAAEPLFENTYGPGLRVEAAEAAARAAAGQGQDADKLDISERNRLRAQAVAWLRAEVALVARHADKEPPQRRAVIFQTLRMWQYHTGFASLRDEKALAQLPPAEQDACRQLWVEISRLADRLQGKGQLRGSPSPAAHP